MIWEKLVTWERISIYFYLHSILENQKSESKLYLKLKVLIIDVKKWDDWINRRNKEMNRYNCELQKYVSFWLFHLTKIRKALPFLKVKSSGKKTKEKRIAFPVNMSRFANLQRRVLKRLPTLVMYSHLRRERIHY